MPDTLLPCALACLAAALWWPLVGYSMNARPHDPPDTTPPASDAWRRAASHHKARPKCCAPHPSVYSATQHGPARTTPSQHTRAIISTRVPASDTATCPPRFTHRPHLILSCPHLRLLTPRNLRLLPMRRPAACLACAREKPRACDPNASRHSATHPRPRKRERLFGLPVYARLLAPLPAARLVILDQHLTNTRLEQHLTSHRPLTGKPSISTHFDRALDRSMPTIFMRLRACRKKRHAVLYCCLLYVCPYVRDAIGTALPHDARRLCRHTPSIRYEYVPHLNRPVCHVHPLPEAPHHARTLYMYMYAYAIYYSFAKFHTSRKHTNLTDTPPLQARERY